MSFFNFDQNNSGGSFVVNDKVCHNLYIEADDYDEAEAKAVSLGVYFDGVEDGRDCPCCGDRWSRGWSDEGITFPKEVTVGWGDHMDTMVLDTIEEYAQLMADTYGWTTPDARIYYKDGTVKAIFTGGTKE